MKQELSEFVLFLWQYVKTRLLNFGQNFEQVKDVIVAFLVVKRGKYSSSFLNTSFLILVGAAVIGAPIIAENNSFSSLFEIKQSKYATKPKKGKNSGTFKRGWFSQSN